MFSKRIIPILVYLAGVSIFSPPCLFADMEGSNHVQQIYAQHQLEQEARDLAENGFLDEAIQKFREALQPQYIKYSFEEAMSRGSIVDILIWQSKYKEALEEHNWFVENNKRNDEAKFREREILALKAYQTMNDSSEARAYISALKTREAKFLPPNAASESTISTILRLHNTIGDHDAGIAYIDEIMAFLKSRKKNRGEDYELYDRIKTVKEADKCMAIGPRQNPNWHGCKLIRAYLLIREAFEQDKAEGFQGCASKKPGEVCMGRATKALIQSDYFPW